MQKFTKNSSPGREKSEFDTSNLENFENFETKSIMSKKSHQTIMNIKSPVTSFHNSQILRKDSDNDLIAG